jgi:hypothetical protein
MHSQPPVQRPRIQTPDRHESYHTTREECANQRYGLRCRRCHIGDDAEEEADGQKNGDFYFTRLCRTYSSRAPYRV